MPNHSSEQLNLLQRAELADIEAKMAFGVLAEQARTGDLLALTQATFHDYEINWHHLMTASILNRMITGELKRVMLFEPPRYGKSELSSRRFPAMIHGLFPDDEILAAAYNGDFASDLAIDVQRILDQPEYQAIFPHTKITPINHVSEYARNSTEHELIPWFDDNGVKHSPRGSYKAAGVGGSFTGRGGKWILIDDPIKNREDADSAAFRETLWAFYTSTIRSRLEKDARILITLTRWHDDDLAGRLIKLAKSNPEADQWFVLSLPAIKEGPPTMHDPRNAGEVLWPTKFSMTDVLATKASSGGRDWASLYQQKPVAEGGNIIKSHWIKYYQVRPKQFDAIFQSWDFATKGKTTSDYVVGQVWGRIGANYYLLDQMRGHWDFPKSCEKLIEMTIRWPSSTKKLVEAKANGPAVVSTLRTKIPGICEVEPESDKVARLNAVADLYEAGQVWYPDPQIAPWIIDHVIELTNFPLDKNDDQVDAASQVLKVLRSATPIQMPIAGHGSGVVF